MPPTVSVEEERSPAAVRASDLRVIALVSACGGIGGVAYWVLQRVSGLEPLGLRWYAAVPALIFLGAVAAVMGVYLGNSDTDKIIPTLAFALICGFGWEPVIKTAANVVTSTIEARSGETVVSTAEALKNELQRPPSPAKVQEVENKAAETANATAVLLNALPSVKDDEVRRKLARDSQTAITTLREASRVEPEVGIKSLVTVGQAAMARNQTEIGDSVLAQLDQIKASNPGLAARVDAAAVTVRRAQPGPPQPR